jgi:mRNA-degrading endonuclease RelE of RelBE toxin-antitoxin system
MTFLIADTFTDSLARLTGEEQKAVKTTAFDLQLNPENPGHSFHKLDKAKDKSFWSVRVGRDIRLIVHKSSGSLLLCYVNHHDKAYAWAERRKLETHPKTGAAQLVEVRETVREVYIPLYSQTEKAAAKSDGLLFDHLDDEELLGYGVPREWLKDVRNATESTILDLTDHLPSEAAQALLELATSGIPHPERPMLQMAAAESPVPYGDPFTHPDAQRRFRVMTNLEELQLALEFPWDKWTVFLHPEQRGVVERTFKGPARVSGSAGTGKTIVALHRAVFLARKHPESRVLLTTFSHILANALRTKLRRLISNEPRLGERIEVHSINSVGARLFKASFGEVAKLASSLHIRELIKSAAADIPDHKFGVQFLISEWEHVVDAWQLQTWESYRDVQRLGRRTRLPEARRALLWKIFERVRAGLQSETRMTVAEMFTRVAEALAKEKHPPYDFAVVDEAQDLGIAQLRFLAALGRTREDTLFFAGDLGQRIFQQPFSWLALGVDIRGRSRSLRVNYRTSHQIRRQADKLLGPEVADADGNTERRSDSVSVFNGSPPEIQIARDVSAEGKTVADWIKARAKDGIAHHEFGVFVRSDAEIPRAKAAVELAGLPFLILDENVETKSGYLSISTMHLAKGLEFRVVAVMACDDEIIPSQDRIEKVGDEGDLKEIYDTERQLLYVACTRARDHLLITSVEPASEFLDDLRS